MPSQQMPAQQHINTAPPPSSEPIGSIPAHSQAVTAPVQQGYVPMAGINTQYVQAGHQASILLFSFCQQSKHLYLFLANASKYQPSSIQCHVASSTGFNAPDFSAHRSDDLSDDSYGSATDGACTPAYSASAATDDDFASTAATTAADDDASSPY